MAKPFKIDVPQDQIDLLHKKLALTTLPDELDLPANKEWDYGAPLGTIKRLLNHWQNNYDWRAAEKKLNDDMPQFTTDVTVEGYGSLNIHFVHKKAEGIDDSHAIPLLFCHGWPGSFIEVRKILGPLTRGEGGGPKFHVVAPSLPNYGFSEGVKKKGFGPRQYAETCHRLMQSLGYDQYVTQGGDWGYFITRTMSLLYPEVKVTHINMSIPAIPTLRNHPILFAQFMTNPYSDFEKAGMKRTRWFQSQGNGYFKEQATKPQTIGYSQADSPIGLLAWIWEKLHDWTDSYDWTDDEVITWISIYVFSRAGPAAASRIYYETAHDPLKTGERIRSYIKGPKVGIARFPKELSVLPKSWAGTMGDVVLVSEYEKGGHFAAWERPDAILKDLKDMFGKGGGAFNVVKGKTGYSESARL